jgi:fused signal recognition particle receptor
LRLLLLENNVAYEVADKIINELEEKIVGKELLKKEIESEIKDSLKEIIREILIEPFDILEKIRTKMNDQAKEPYVILFSGINGTGKTTTIAKIADYLKKKNISCVLAAADTFRAASIEQLEQHGDRIGVKVISQQYGADPAAVGFDAISYAKKNFINCVLIDTAGRMHTSKNLIKEIEKISRVCKPDTKIFVGESITGNDSVEQAKSFDWAIGIDGIVLTKADVDEKGGTALSVGYVTKKPILFLGTGQEYSKIKVFNKEEFLKELGL